MGPLAVQLLLESVLVPMALAGVIMAIARFAGRGSAAPIAPALAILLAVGSTCLLAFGWQAVLAGDARSKILLSAVIGVLAGLIIERHPRGRRLWLAAGAIALPLWVGLPALQQGRADGALLVLPIAAALAALRLFDDDAPSSRTPRLLTAFTLAVGVAMIAALGRTLSLAEIGLALASALIVILTVGRGPLTTAAGLAAGAMLLTSITALLLYSEASLPALLLLGMAAGAERIARVVARGPRAEPALRHVLLLLLLPAVAALIIARIDAGSISIY